LSPALEFETEFFLQSGLKFYYDFHKDRDHLLKG